MPDRAKALFLATLLLAGTRALASAPEPLDVLAVYTDAAADHYAGAPVPRIEHLAAVADDVFARSGVPLALRLAAVEATTLGPVAETPATLERLTLADDPAAVAVRARRDAIGADVVVLFSSYAGDGYCGVTWLGGTRTPGVLDARDRDHGYAVVALDCGAYTLVHELGHLLGLVHSRREVPGGGTEPWAAGHGVDGRFTTVMAPADSFGAPRLPQLSDPDRRACFGEPCGVPGEDPVAGAHAVRTVLATAPQLVAYRTPPSAIAPTAEAPAAAASRPLAEGSGSAARDPASAPATAGGGCAVGAAHDDPTLPLLLAVALAWQLRCRPAA